MPAFKAACPRRGVSTHRVGFFLDFGLFAEFADIDKDDMCDEVRDNGGALVTEDETDDER